MAISINLLAEAQSLDELRRRDPVKRAILAGALLVFVMIAWSGQLQFEAMWAKGELRRLDSQLATQTNQFQKVLRNERELAEVNRKLSSLQRLASNRLLYGTLLNALQQATIDDVQLAHLRADQSYVLTQEVKGKTNGTHIIPGKPATSTERILLTLDARDSGPNPGDQVNRFKQAIGKSPYFSEALGKTNEVRLTSLSPPQISADSGKPFVLFTLECRFGDRTR